MSVYMNTKSTIPDDFLVTLIDNGQQIKINKVEYHCQAESGPNLSQTGGLILHRYITKKEEVNFQEDKVHPLLIKLTQVPKNDYEALSLLFSEITNDPVIENRLYFASESSSSKIWKIVKVPLEELTEIISSLFIANQKKQPYPHHWITYTGFSPISTKEVFSILEQKKETQQSTIKLLKDHSFQVLDLGAAYMAMTCFSLTIASISALSIYSAGAFFYGGAHYLVKDAFTFTY